MFPRVKINALHKIASTSTKTVPCYNIEESIASFENEFIKKLKVNFKLKTPEKLSTYFKFWLKFSLYKIFCFTQNDKINRSGENPVMFLMFLV